MGDFHADPDAIRAYGATSAAIGDAVTAAGSMDLAANMAVMVPVFGLIGQDFLASFGLAQFANVTSLAQLAAVHQGSAISAAMSAAQYEGTDHSTSGALNKAVTGL